MAHGWFEGIEGGDTRVGGRRLGSGGRSSLPTFVLDVAIEILLQSCVFDDAGYLFFRQALACTDTTAPLHSRCTLKQGRHATHS